MAEKEKNKDALLQDTLKQIEKQYGKGSIMKLGDRANVDIDAISSGSIAIDYCTRSPSARKPAAERRLSTRKTRSTRCTRRIWASRSTI